METWNRINILADDSIIHKIPEARMEVKTLLGRLVKRIDLDRRDWEGWGASFPDWSRPHLAHFSAFSMRDPDEDDDFVDDDNPGTPKKLSPEEKIIAAVEFWNGARFLLRYRIVLPCPPMQG